MANIQPVTKSRHGDKYWKRITHFNFAGGDALCPLVIQELPRAAACLPVAFVTADDTLTPVAVQSLEPGKNLLVAPNGQWLAEYIPASYRGYPFRLAASADGKQVLCIDEDSGVITDDPNDERFFDNADNPSEAITGLLNFHDHLLANRQATNTVSRQLQKFGLICPWLFGTDSQNHQSDAGLSKIDEDALNKLPAESLLELRNSGGLGACYAQLLSMQQLTKLQRLAAVIAANKEKIDNYTNRQNLGWFDDMDTINFDNL
ncbi:MAG: SapC family protein [Pseudohongiellaceae bacterium]